MSFILEALKRSENERQRKIGPSLADVQVRAQRSEKPWWAFAVAGLLLVNLAVLLIVLLRDDAPTAPVQQNTAVRAPVPNAPPLPAPSVVTTTPPINRPELRQQRAANEPAATTGDPSVRSLADEAAVGGEDAFTYPPENPDLAVAAVVPDRSSIVRPIQSQSAAPNEVRPLPQRQAPSEPEEVLPTFRELGGTAANLPDLHLDIHVHSPVPAERFVFVNMRKYIEGQTLSEGPLVERINSQGVVLNHRGLRFLLPRQ